VSGSKNLGGSGVRLGSSWRRRLADVVDLALVGSGINAVWRGQTRDRLRVLAFHGVDDPANFDELIEIIATEWRPVSLDDVLSWFRGQEIPDRAVLVTFDDGDPSVLEHGLPTLRKWRVPAVAFVIASLVDSNAPTWWSEIEALREPDDVHLVRRLKTIPDRERRAALDKLRRDRGESVVARQLSTDDVQHLRDAGVEIGNHTHTHPILSRCEPEVVRREIVVAHDRLAEILGNPPRAFAYPNGDHETNAEQALDPLGYEVAFLFDHRLTGRKDPRYRVSRLRVDSTTPARRLRVVLSGLHPSLLVARRKMGLV
jgi:peptidoglycan/xylan/chitin deacetylase (PgdA/CDA1 family)